MQQSSSTLILTCNSGHAKWFINKGPQDGVHEIRDTEQFIPKASDLTDGKRGRNKPSNDASQRHAYAPPTDPREKEKREFVEEIAESLNGREKSIEQLVIAASPDALHVLRETLSPQLKNKLS